MAAGIRFNFVLGVAAALGAALIGAGWQVATRAGATTSLQPIDLALLRYSISGLALAPLLLRRGLWPTAASPWLFAPMFLGAGLPFGLLAMGGAAFAPVAHMGALLPGTMPFFTALLAAAIWGGRIGAWRLFGFALVGIGIAAVVRPDLAGAAPEAWIGDLLFVAASCAWAVYSVAYRASGLDPWHATALLAAASACICIPIWLMSGGGARLAAAPSTDLALQSAVQGFVAGLLGMWVYAEAIRRLGAARAALSGAAVPVLTMLGGIFWLSEGVTWIAVAGALLIVVGIAAATPRPAR